MITIRCFICEHQLTSTIFFSLTRFSFFCFSICRSTTIFDNNLFCSFKFKIDISTIFRSCSNFRLCFYVFSFSIRDYIQWNFSIFDHDFCSTNINRCFQSNNTNVSHKSMIRWHNVKNCFQNNVLWLMLFCSFSHPKSLTNIMMKIKCFIILYWILI